MTMQLSSSISRRGLLALAASIAAEAGFASEVSFDLKLAGGKLPEEMRLIRVTQGDAVTLRWSSDRPLIIHLHGYDIERRLTPGTTTAIEFTAYAAGRFPIHVHGAAGTSHDDAPLAVIEVYPK